MRVFLSHSSNNKSNVKSIVAYMPKQLKTWLDEENLVWGSCLDETFESVIKSEVDYVLVFLSGTRGNNAWVIKELKWALEHEKKIGRRFVLPIIMPEIGNPYEEFPEIEGIKYITLDNYEETGFKSCAEKITTQLFSLIITDLENAHKPKKQVLSKQIYMANDVIDDLCKKVYNIIFHHRSQNPITVDELFNELNEKTQGDFNKEEFPELLNKICSMLSGIYYDGLQLFLIEEHSKWKNNVSIDNKIAIAHGAAKYIRNGLKIYIDAGSTMKELVNIIEKRIESRTLCGISVVVISTEHASKLADACSKLGYDQYSAPIKLYMPCGMVRPNTKAIAVFDGESDIDRICKNIGNFDIAFIGANGATAKDGIYTHENEELIIKKDAIAHANKVYYLMDDSKCGLVLESKLADFNDDDVHVIINENPNNADLNEIIEKFPTKVEVVKKIK